MLVRDREIDAAAAHAWGIVTEIVEGDVRGHAREVAESIAGMRPGAVARTRALLDLEGLAAALEEERRAFVEHIVTPEAREGMRWFLGR